MPTLYKKPQTDQIISLNISVKGDKFLYYKRKIEHFESKMKVFPFWNSPVVWMFTAYSASTIYFILFLIDKSFYQFPEQIPLFLFERTPNFLDKSYLYFFCVAPLVNFLITFLIGYKIFNTQKHLSYTLMLINAICTALFLIALIKTIQMNYAILPL